MDPVTKFDCCNFSVQLLKWCESGQSVDPSGWGKPVEHKVPWVNAGSALCEHPGTSLGEFYAVWCHSVDPRAPWGALMVRGPFQDVALPLPAVQWSQVWPMLRDENLQPSVSLPWAFQGSFQSWASCAREATALLQTLSHLAASASDQPLPCPGSPPGWVFTPQPLGDSCASGQQSPADFVNGQWFEPFTQDISVPHSLPDHSAPPTSM